VRARLPGAQQHQLVDSVQQQQQLPAGTGARRAQHLLQRAWRYAAVEVAGTEKTGRRTDPKADEWSTRPFVPTGIWLWFCPSTMGHGHRPSMMEGWVPKGGPLVTGHCLGLPGCLAGAVALCGCARAYSSHCCLQLLYYRSDYLGFSCPSKPIWAAIAAVLVWFPLLGSGQCSLFSEPFRRFHRRCM